MALGFNANIFGSLVSSNKNSETSGSIASNSETSGSIANNCETSGSIAFANTGGPDLGALGGFSSAGSCSSGDGGCSSSGGGSFSVCI